MRFLVAVGLSAVAFSASRGAEPPPPAFKIVPGRSTERLREDLKSKLEKADAVVVARFAKTNVIESKVVDKTHTIHTLHSQFATLSVLKGTAADEFTLLHQRDEYRAVDQGIVINDIPIRYDFRNAPISAHNRDGETAKVLDEPVYFLYLRRLKDKAVKGELYEVVEINEFIGPGAYEAVHPWMDNYYGANRKKK